MKALGWLRRLVLRIARRKQRAFMARLTDEQLYRLATCERPESAQVEAAAIEVVMRLRGLDRSWPYRADVVEARRERLRGTLWLLEGVARARRGQAGEAARERA